MSLRRRVQVWGGVLALAVGCDGSTRAPTEPPTVRRLVAGDLALVGAGDGCTRTSSRSEDGWCAFARLPGDPSGPTELWVVNVRRALAAEISCDGTDPACVRLTDRLWTDFAFGGASHPEAHRFDGRTLIFHAGGVVREFALYEGPVWAWRPEWSRPRMISSDRGVLCRAHPMAAAAYCLDGATGDPVRPTNFDLLAGTLSDSDTPLPRVARIVPFHQKGAVAWQAEFSPDGDRLAFSTTGDGTGREVLRVVQLAAPSATTTPVRAEATQWRIARDGRKIYYLRDFNYSSDEPDGVLEMADFPSGANPRVLSTGAGRIELTGKDSDAELGLTLRRGYLGGQVEVSLLRDRNRPDDRVTLGNDLGAVYSSRDGRHTHYIEFAPGGEELTMIAHNDGKGSCLLNNDRDGFPYGCQFLESSGLIAWLEATKDGVSEAWFADADGCKGRTRFASKVTDVFTVIPDRGVLFGEEIEGAPSVRLRFAATGAGSPAADPITVAPRAAPTASFVGTLAAGVDYIVFQVVDGPREGRGLFAWGPVAGAR